MRESETQIFQGLSLVAVEVAFAVKRLLSGPSEGPAAVTHPDEPEQT